MATWFKWWKDKTFMTVLIIALLTMLIGFLIAYFIKYGWLVTCILSIISGVSIKKIITNRINEELRKQSEIKMGG